MEENMSDEFNKDRVVEMEEDYDDGDSEDEGGDVQLGFIDSSTNNELFHDNDWRNWDGGKVGGQPVWLNPADVPPPSALQCTHCGDPLQFLLQIYCPVDEVPDAFHRSIYLFCCKRKDCLKMGSAKCLRSQLPRVNQHYSFDPAAKDQPSATSASPIAPLCSLCGCRGGLVCSQCKGVSYCSKAHQKEHWKCHKLVCKGTATSSSSAAQQAEALVREKALFPEYCIEVEAEVFGEDDEQELKTIMEKANIWEDAVTEGGTDEEADAKLTQADYQKALGSEVHDPTYINFLTRVERGGRDQVLRYYRAPVASQSEHASQSADVHEANSHNQSSTNGSRSSKGLLLLSSDKELLRQRAERLAAHPCARCGAPRSFECQVMPQLLHFLKVDQHTSFNVAGGALVSAAAAEAEAAATASDAAESAPPAPSGGDLSKEKPFLNNSDKDIDWGSIDVFTCSASCAVAAAGEGAYVEELVMLQPPVYQDH